MRLLKQPLRNKVVLTLFLAFMSSQNFANSEQRQCFESLWNYHFGYGVFPPRLFWDIGGIVGINGYENLPNVNEAILTIWSSNPPASIDSNENYNLPALFEIEQFIKNN